MELYNITDLISEYQAPCLQWQESLQDFIKDFGGKRNAKKELKNRLEKMLVRYENSGINLISLRMTYEKKINAI